MLLTKNFNELFTQNKWENIPAVLVEDTAMKMARRKNISFVSSRRFSTLNKGSAIINQ